MSYNSKYKGVEVEEALDKFANGKVGNIGAVDTNESVDEPDMPSNSYDELLEEIDKKADEEGYYSKLSVGLADNLLGHAPTVERKIVFDATASKNNDVTDDVARIESIKGNSIVWNQTYPTNFNFTSNGISVNSENNILTLNGIASSDHVQINSKGGALLKTNNIGLFVCEVIKDENSLLEGGKLSLFNRGILGNITNGFACGTYSSSDASLGWGFGIGGFETGNEFVDIQIKIAIYDLTQMFGAGNEPSTIEEFYSLIPKGVDIYEYNQSEVIHNYANGLKSVGFNAWDEDWEEGGFTNGIPTSSNNQIRSKNFCNCIGGEQYYLKCADYNNTYYVAIEWYDKDYKHIKTEYRTALTTTAPINAKYFKLMSNSSTYIYGNKYNNDICFNLAHTGYRNGEYEKYWQETISLPNTLVFPNGMKSAGTAYDEIYYDKYAKKWRVIKRIGEVDLGSLNYVKTATGSLNTLYHASIPDIVNTKYLATHLTFNGITNSLKWNIQSQNQWDIKEGISGDNNHNNSIFVSTKQANNVSEVKQLLNGVVLYYELNKPIESALEDYLPSTMSADEKSKVLQLLYRVNDFGTEEMLCEGKSSALVADIVYGVDAYRTLVNLRKRVAALENK